MFLIKLSCLPSPPKHSPLSHSIPQEFGLEPKGFRHLTSIGVLGKIYDLASFERTKEVCSCVYSRVRCAHTTGYHVLSQSWVHPNFPQYKEKETENATVNMIKGNQVGARTFSVEGGHTPRGDQVHPESDCL